MLADSYRNTTRAMDSISLTAIADLILATGTKELLGPGFNQCAKRVAWGALPKSGVKVDVFKKYRDAGLITWTAA